MNSTPDSHLVGTSASLSPDGQQIWSIFERAYTSSFKYAPQDFRFLAGSTPMSTWPSMLSVLVAYYSIILGGREIMRGAAELHLQGAQPCLVCSVRNPACLDARATCAHDPR